VQVMGISLGCGPNCVEVDAGRELHQLIGPPTASLCSPGPGNCALGEEWIVARLTERFTVAHNSCLLTFILPNPCIPLGLSTCASILCRIEGLDGHVVRPYTPVSTNATHGRFRLLLKIYKNGTMSRVFKEAPIGETFEFKHSLDNVQIQYPFNRRYITMLAGGTGITPMIQALHAILGMQNDTTRVTLLFGNKTKRDILAEDLLSAWSRNSEGRFICKHVLSAEPSTSDWMGDKGFISSNLIRKYSAPPQEDVLVMVCGPPAMYSFLCGPQNQSDVGGILGDMGYSADQVYKF